MADAEKLARRIYSLEQTTAGLARTQQIARSSVTVTDAGEDESGEPIAETRDVSLSDVLVGAVDTAEDVASHGEDLALLDESTTQTVEDTSDLFTFDEDRGDEVSGNLDYAIEVNQYAVDLDERLTAELDAAKAELESALAEAHDALTEAGQARSEAAQAVADAQAAVTQATDAIQKALEAADLAEGAAPTWSTAAPTAGDASGKPVGAIWYVRDGAGKVSQMWELQSLGWFQRPFAEAAIPEVAIGSGTYGALAGDRLVANSITAAQIQALAITANEIAASAVTAVKLAADSVVAAKIAAGAVTTDKLNALAVTADKLAAGSVVADKIAAGAIVAGKLAATAIDGMTITGALFRTAPSGQRMEWTTSGIRAFNSAGVLQSSMTPEPFGFLLQGGLMMSYDVSRDAVMLLDQNGILVQGDLAGAEPRSQLAPGFLQIDAPARTGALSGSVGLSTGGVVGGPGPAVSLYAANSAMGGAGKLEVYGVSGSQPNGGIRLSASRGGVAIQTFGSEKITLDGRVDAPHLPYAMAAGAINYGATIVNGTGVTINGVLPAGRFTVAPVVTSTVIQAGRLNSAIAGTTTTTAFQVRLDNFSGATAQLPIGVNWHAVQMTPTSGAG